MIINVSSLESINQIDLSSNDSEPADQPNYLKVIVVDQIKFHFCDFIREEGSVMSGGICHSELDFSGRTEWDFK